MIEFKSRQGLKKSFNRIAMMMVLLLSFSSFGQSIDDKSLTEESAPASTSASIHATQTNNMEFVMWFMGSKENVNGPISTEDNSSTRKQIMTSGSAPNRLLIKALLKKAVNFEISIA